MGAMIWTGSKREPGDPSSPYVHFARIEANASPGLAHLYGAEGSQTGRRGSAWPHMTILGQEFSQIFGEIDGTVADLLPWDVVHPALRGPDVEISASVLDKPPPGPPPTPGSVFVGIIDDGIAFAHERFRTIGRRGKPRTRFDYLWLQGAPHRGKGDQPFGRRLYRKHIDKLLLQHRDGPAIDEAALYRDPGVRLIDLSREEVQTTAQAQSHGTAVLDLAAGYKAARPEAARVAIVGVALPVQVTADTLGVFAELFVTLAIERILSHVEARRQQAARLWGSDVDYPVVINISLALTAGSKDGGSVLDRLIDAVTRSRQGRAPVRFVLPAGNHRLAMTHAVLDRPNEGRQSLTWRLPPDDLTPSFVEIWGKLQNSRPDAPSFSIALTPAGSTPGAVIAPLAFDHVYRLTGSSGPVAWAYCDWIPSAEGGRERVVLVVPPTSGDRAYICPGDWTIEVAAQNGASPWPLQCYVQRDDTLPGFRRRGRQSYFVDPAYRARDADGRIAATDPPQNQAMVRRSGTMNSLATSDSAIVAGGRYKQSKKEVPYSGLSEADMASRAPKWKLIGPFAACDRSETLDGILAASSLSGGRAAISGTSLSSARVARKISAKLLRSTFRPDSG